MMKPLFVSFGFLFQALTANAFSDAVKNVRGNLGGDRIISLPFSALTDSVRNIIDSAGADEFGNTVVGTDLRLSAEAVEALSLNGVEFTDTTEAWIEQFEKNFENERFVCQDSGEACASSPDFFSQYQRMDAIYSRFDNISTSSPLATIGSIGSSYEGTDIKTIFIGSGDKPTVLYFCGVHAREWLPPMFCTHMAEQLVANGGHPILEKVKFTIVPLVNPDGYEFSHENDNLWRKSRKPNPTNAACVGTDLNRNYDDHHCGEGASTNECAATYCGVTPFDNVETQNLKNYTEDMIASGETLLSQVDVHSYGQYWMSPWGWTLDLPPADDFNEMTACMLAAKSAILDTSGLNFKTGSTARAIYIASGGSDDWYYSAFGVKYAYTIECRGDSFQPDPSNIIPSNEEIFAGMLAQVECSYSRAYPDGFGEPDVEPEEPEVPCFDMSKTNILLNGAEAKCSDLPNFCFVEKFVRERCPQTCNQCGPGYQNVSDSSLQQLSGDGIQAEEDGSEYAIIYMVAIPVVGGILIGSVAACLLLRSKPSSTSHYLEAKGMVSEGIKRTETESTLPGKPAASPNSMYQQTV